MKKILVLPYDISNDIGKNTFQRNSILEELIDQLTFNTPLNILSKTTSQYLAQNPLPAKLLKEIHDIDFLLEGGLTVAKDGFVISTRLLNTEDESTKLRLKHTFAQTQIASVLEQIAHSVYESIEVKIAPIPVVPDPSTTSDKAQEYYLKGLYHWNRYTHQELKLAIQHFKDALKYDENFAQAYAAIADCYCVIGVMGYEAPKTTFQTAKGFVEKAFQLNNKRSETFVSAGLINMFLDRDYAQAKSNLAQAILLNKNNLNAHHSFAMYYLHTNNLNLAEKHAAFNVKKAPLDIPYYDMLAKIYLYKKEFKKGLSFVERALELDKTSIEIKELEGHLNMHLGNFEKAIECYQICRFKSPKNPLYYSNLAYIFAKCNYHFDSRKVIEDMQKLKSTTENLGTFHYAQSIIKLGQLNYKDFFKHINLALEKGLGMFIGEIICNPIYNEIRKDKRFKSVLEKLSLDNELSKPSRKKLASSSATLTTKTKQSLTLDPQYLAYVESHGNYSKIFWFEQNILRNKLLRVPISHLEQQLSTYSYIHRCHKSYLINLNEPLSISGNTKGHFFECDYYPIRIPISRGKAALFCDLINE